MFRAVRLLLIAAAVVLPTGVCAQGNNTVTIGYQLAYNPWIVAIANGAFEQNTGYEIQWRKFESGAKAINALAVGGAQIVWSGSSPAAAGLSRGMDIEVAWIFEDIASAEALVVRDESDIVAPQDLKGKTLAVPFASTTHFHLLFALEQFGIAANEVTIKNMQPPEIVAAWQDGTIDGTFVWDPALGQVKKSGRVLITSGLLSSWGKATFDAGVADRTFAKQNPEFMCQFIKTVAAADQSYRSDPQSWTPESPEVQAIVSLVGGDPADVPKVLELYQFPTLEEQVSDRWLGGGGSGGAAQALRFTAEFLKSEGKVSEVLDDYGPHVNPRWARMVLDGEC